MSPPSPEKPSPASGVTVPTADRLRRAGRSGARTRSPHGRAPRGRPAQFTGPSTTSREVRPVGWARAESIGGQAQRHPVDRGPGVPVGNTHSLCMDCVERGARRAVEGDNRGGAGRAFWNGAVARWVRYRCVIGLPEAVRWRPWPHRPQGDHRRDRGDRRTDAEAEHPARPRRRTPAGRTRDRNAPRRRGPR